MFKQVRRCKLDTLKIGALMLQKKAEVQAEELGGPAAMQQLVPESALLGGLFGIQ